MVLLMTASVVGYAQQTDVEVKKGDYNPEWNSLSQWECPEWFMDAKFGIWAHWGPQCHAEAGDWYARFMYYMGSGQQNWHWDHFGDPAEFGLKELCNDWKAQNWNPERLVNLYKSVGARYFMALGNHHDNFDLWNSPYQEWNSVNMGPKRDLLKEWYDACRKVDLKVGVSMHASHAWTWLEPSQEYDGNLTKEDGYKLNADGTEKWWKGYDPQELYAQNHVPSNGWRESGTIHSQWEWGNGASLPSQEYKQKFQNRVLQCINDYQPDMIYFDDTAMPFYGCDDNIGKNILAHYYNSSAAQHDGTPQVVVTGKQLDADQKKFMLWDVERGIPDRMQEKYWQTCTCIGSWHYDQNVYNGNGYKSAAQVVRMLVDIVSKNGNLLLSVPIRSDGTIDEKEEAVLAGIKAWMDQNGESIYGTRTWKTFGEGPLAEASNPMNAQGFNEGLNYSARDVRYVQKDGKVYATIMAWPGSEEFTFECFSIISKYYSGKVTSVELLGHGNVEYKQGVDGLTITVPATRCNEIAPVFVITLEEDAVRAYDKLQATIKAVEEYVAKVESIASFTNTGKPSTLALPALREALAKAKEATADMADAALEDATATLLAVYEDFKKNGMNKGGKFTGTEYTDITKEYLVEPSGFTRAEGDTRFGKPEYWTVENFKIPNGGDGVKQGLDKHEGRDALMLGVWNDAANNQEGNLAHARIYRRIRLGAGRYYFGAAFNACYQVSPDAYMFVSSELYDTDAIPGNAIAYYALAEATNNMQLYGLNFTLTEDTDLYIGFQMNLTSGSTTQEIRAVEIALYRYNEITHAKLQDLIEEISAKADAVKVGDNTGYYTVEASDALKAAIAETRTVADDVSAEEIVAAYDALTMAYGVFLDGGRVKGTTYDEAGAADVTEQYLVEIYGFTRAKGGNDRFGIPLYWTVENYGIPSNSEGTRGGLDKWPGRDHLTLGVWDDKQNAPETSDITDARVYRRVELEAGTYFFGAIYNTVDNITNAYVFAAGEPLATTDIPDKAIAHMTLMECRADGEYWGIRFTITEAQEVLLGWQADLLNSPARQEFRAEKVKLAYYGTTAMEDMEYAGQPVATSIYTLQGVKVSEDIGTLPRGLYIMNGKKLLVK